MSSESRASSREKLLRILGTIADTGDTSLEELLRILNATVQSISDDDVSKIKQALKGQGRDPDDVADRVQRDLLNALSLYTREPRVEAEAQTLDDVEKLYREYSAQIYAFVLRMVRDRNWAEDLLQATFLRALEKLGTLRDTSKIRSWLHKIAYNLVMEAGRETRKRKEFAVDDSTLLDTLGKSDQTELRHDLEKAIGELPPEQRAVLIKHDIEGWSHTEIADMMDKDPSTVRAEVSLARHRVRATLGGNK